MLLNRLPNRRSALALVVLCFVACDDDEPPPAEDTGGGDGGDATDTPLDEDVTPYVPPEALAAVVDLAALHDRETLDIEVELDRSGEVPGDFAEPVWQIGFRFYSIDVAGNPWHHSVFLVVPDTLPSDVDSVGIIQRVADNPVENISDSASFLPQYAALTADRLDMPVLLITDLLPAVDFNADATLAAVESELPQCFAGAVSDADLLFECLLQVSQATGRLELFPPVPAAQVMVRSVTLLEALVDLIPTLDLPFDVPPFAVRQVVVGASGLAGYATRYAMALDDRIRGAMVASANIGNLADLYQLQDDLWQSNFPLGEPAPQTAFWDSAAADPFHEAFDLVSIEQSLSDRAWLVAQGTNDPAFPLETLALYESLLPDDRAQLYVPNYGRGLGSSDQLLGWRVLLAHMFRDRPWARVVSRHEEDGGNITVIAGVFGGTIVESVQLWYVQRHDDTDDTDFRDALWASMPMVETAGEWTASFPNTLANTAFFVRVLDAEDIYEGPLTGPMTVVSE